MALEKEWYHKEIEDIDSEEHRPMEEEMQFYDAVKSGNIDFVRENCEKNEFGNPTGMGILSSNPLRNFQYHFIITCALITRYCVEGGLELEQAYRLSDFYIQKMDKYTRTEDIIALHHTMVLDFTGKMLLLQKNAIISKSITLAIDYIYQHLHDRITIQELADTIGLSPSYLSKLFKRELGISVSDYIREKKIENAQNLLKYSNYDITDIANYLAFSSQSHFIQVFQKYIGMTPKKYRNTYFRSKWDTKLPSAKKH